MTFQWLNGLAVRLGLAFVALTLASVVLAAFLVEQATTSEFEAYLASRQQMGRGPGTGPPSDRPGPTQMLGALEDAFLTQVRSTLWLSGGISVAAAAALGAILALQIARPVQKLAIAAAAVAQGQLEVQVPTSGPDELARLGRAFNAMAVSLQQHEAQRRSLLSDIAHELRTPLTILQSNLEAIQDGLLEPSTEQLAILHEETLVLAKLIEDLRTLSLLEAGQLQLELRSVDLTKLAGRLVAEMEARAAQRQIDLRIDAAAAVSAKVDTSRIGQVLRNLLENALTYTPKGGSVRVQVTRDAREAHIAVLDTGSGIAPEALPHVFDRFYRADPSRTRSSGGSGLGLAIVKQIVQAHGGRVWAESTPGQGSTFHVALPNGN